MSKAEIKTFSKTLWSQFFTEKVRKTKYPGIDVKYAYYDLQDFLMEFRDNEDLNPQIKGFIQELLEKYFYVAEKDANKGGYEKVYQDIKQEIRERKRKYPLPRFGNLTIVKLDGSEKTSLHKFPHIVEPPFIEDCDDEIERAAWQHGFDEVTNMLRLEMKERDPKSRTLYKCPYCGANSKYFHGIELHSLYSKKCYNSGGVDPCYPILSRMAEDRPYIGITGIYNEKDLREVLNSFARFDLKLNDHQDFVPMVGFLASEKTLYKDKQYDAIIKNYCNLLSIARGRAFRTLHYYTKDRENFKYNLLKLLAHLAFDVDGIQLNIECPDPGELSDLRTKLSYHSRKKISIIIQLSDALIERMEELLPKYGNVEYILIDKSRGKGKPLDVNESCDLYKKIKALGIKATIGFAGGLNPYGSERVGTIIPKLETHLNTREFSIDAESGLKWDHNKYRLDPLKVHDYIRQASVLEDKNQTKIEDFS